MTSTVKIAITLVLIVVAIGVIQLVPQRGEDLGNSVSKPEQSTPVDPHTNLIQVSTPLSGALITSPVLVSGMARGNWYFEASFPVEIIDANGLQLALIPAQAGAEWMTTESVPFSVEVPFTEATTDTGFVVLHKDNPSGLIENEDEVSIPVRFK